MRSGDAYLLRTVSMYAAEHNTIPPWKRRIHYFFASNVA